MIPGRDDLGECPYCGAETTWFGPVHCAEEYCDDCGKVRIGIGDKVVTCESIAIDTEEDDSPTPEETVASGIGDFA